MLDEVEKLELGEIFKFGDVGTESESTTRIRKEDIESKEIHKSTTTESESAGEKLPNLDDIKLNNNIKDPESHCFLERCAEEKKQPPKVKSSNGNKKGGKKGANSKGGVTVESEDGDASSSY